MEQNTTTVTNPQNEQTNVTATKDNPTNQPTITTETTFSKDSIKQELSELGLDGLEFDYASFPIISLKGNAFEMKADPDYNPNSFIVTVIKTTEKHVLSDANDDNYQDVKYSPDGIVTRGFLQSPPIFPVLNFHLLSKYDASLISGNFSIIKIALDVFLLKPR